MAVTLNSVILQRESRLGSVAPSFIVFGKMLLRLLREVYVLPYRALQYDGKTIE
jgi:hypothetical protein